MSWGMALLSAILLARRLRSTWAGQEMVGILLPPSVPGALVNFAAVLSGKIPVNLNYTSSNETLESCAQQCKLRDGDYDEAVARAHSAEGARENNFAGRGGGFTAVRRER